MAQDFIGVGALAGETTHTGAEPDSITHGPIKTGAGNRLHFGDAQLRVGSLRGTTSGGGTLIGSSGATAADCSALQAATFDSSTKANLTPANGMVIYNSTTTKFELYENGAWVNVGSAGVTLDQAYDFGGAGSGRTINVDESLPVVLQAGTGSPTVAMVIGNNLAIQYGTSSGTIQYSTTTSALAIAGRTRIEIPQDDATGFVLVNAGTTREFIRLNTTSPTSEKLTLGNTEDRIDVLAKYLDISPANMWVAVSTASTWDIQLDEYYKALQYRDGGSAVMTIDTSNNDVEFGYPVGIGTSAYSGIALTIDMLPTTWNQGLAITSSGTYAATDLVGIVIENTSSTVISHNYYAIKIENAPTLTGGWKYGISLGTGYNTGIYINPDISGARGISISASNGAQAIYAGTGSAASAVELYTGSTGPAMYIFCENNGPAISMELSGSATYGINCVADQSGGAYTMGRFALSSGTYAYSHTGLKIDFSPITSLSGAFDSYGLYLAGELNVNAGDYYSIGSYYDANWDLAAYCASDVMFTDGNGLRFYSALRGSNRGSIFYNTGATALTVASNDYLVLTSDLTQISGADYIYFNASSSHEFQTGDVNIAKRLNMPAHTNNVGLKVPTSNGAPGAVTGVTQGDIDYDYTNNRLYVYDTGSGWVYTTLGTSGTVVSLNSAYESGNAIDVDSSSPVTLQAGTGSPTVAMVIGNDLVLQYGTTSATTGYSSSAIAFTTRTSDSATAARTPHIYNITGENTSTGPSGSFTVITGDAVSGSTGGITLATGNTSGTRGKLSIDVGAIEIITSTATSTFGDGGGFFQFYNSAAIEANTTYALALSGGSSYCLDVNYTNAGTAIDVTSTHASAYGLQVHGNTGKATYFAGSGSNITSEFYAGGSGTAIYVFQESTGKAIEVEVSGSYALDAVSYNNTATASTIAKLAFSSGTYPYAHTGLSVDLSPITTLAGAYDSYGIKLLGKTNTNAGDYFSIGTHYATGWDLSTLHESPSLYLDGASVSFASAMRGTTRGGLSYYTPDSAIRLVSNSDLNLLASDDISLTAAGGAVGIQSYSATTWQTTGRSGATAALTIQTGDSSANSTGSVLFYSGLSTSTADGTYTSGDVAIGSGGSASSSYKSKSGDLQLRTGDSYSTTGANPSSPATGWVVVKSGDALASTGAAESGFLALQTGNSTYDSSGYIDIASGTSAWGSGYISLKTGSVGTSGLSGALDLYTGNVTHYAGDGNSGPITIRSGNSTGRDSGAILIKTGTSNASRTSGNITLQCGNFSGTTSGYIYMEAKDVYLAPPADANYYYPHMVFGTGSVKFVSGSGAPSGYSGYSNGTLYLDYFTPDLYILVSNVWKKITRAA